MMNILLPMAGHSGVSEEMGYPYPYPLIELRGKPMIERVVENLREVDEDCRFIFVLREDDCRRFHLDNTVQLLAPPRSVVIKLSGETRGALCTALMAISHIDNESPLLVANSDQLFESGMLARFIQEMKASGADAGCSYLQSVHPRWSYLCIEDGLIVQAAEKNPISKDAIAGIYYFSTGQLFVQAAKRAILNGRVTDGRYYLSAVINELILESRRVVGFPVPNDKYHSFFTQQRIEEYERLGEQSAHT